MLRCPRIQEGFQKARLEELRMLVEVAESGSLSAAARKLRVPKSTVGRAVRRIEDDLGVALVRRMTKGPVLTEPGRVLADMAAPHIAALRDAPAALGRTASEVYGLLRITTLADVGALVLAPLLPSFLARHPRVRPEVALGLSSVDLTRAGFDVGIRVAMSASLPSSSLIAKKLGPVNIAFYAVRNMRHGESCRSVCKISTTTTPSRSSPATRTCSRSRVRKARRSWSSERA
jgi:DNA-binding transcriptional LysR family regulator